MAEVLGAVASGLAVAETGLKVGGTLWKLRKLWQQVHEVPETVQALMRQIELMDPVLSDHETNFDVKSVAIRQRSSTPNNSQALMSAEYCRKALNDLQSLVEDLDGAIESEKRIRRTFAKMKVVLKKDTIKEFQERLDRALKLLQCTQVNYLVANAMMTGAMVTDMWAAVTDIQQKLNQNSLGSVGRPPFPIANQSLDASWEQGLVKTKGNRRQVSGASLLQPRTFLFGTLQVQYVQSETKTGDEATYNVRFRLPKWLSRKAWDVMINRACSGWQASLTTWNTVPKNSPGFVCAKRGNLDELLDLFRRGLASPRDCDGNGFTLLHYATVHLQADIVEYFCNMDLNQPYIQSVARTLFESGLLMTPFLIDILQQLVSRGVMDEIADEVEEAELSGAPMTERLNDFMFVTMLYTIWTSHSPEVFELCFRTVFPFWHNLPPIRKQQLLMMEWTLQYWCPQVFRAWAAQEYSPWTSDALRLLLSPERHVRKNDVQSWIGGGASVLHQVFLYFLRSESCTANQDWEILLRESLEATDDVQHRLRVPCVYELSFIGNCSALEFALVGELGRICGLEKVSIDDDIFHTRISTQRLLRRTMMKLQSMMSVIASCGHDLLEFGRREAKTWGVDRYPDRDRNGGDDTLFLGIGDQHGGIYIKAVHYGSDPWDWYFEIEYNYEDYAGDFWHLLENPHLFMVPGGWID